MLEKISKFPIFSEYLFGQICDYLGPDDVFQLCISFGITTLPYSLPVQSGIDQQIWILPEINSITLRIASSLQKYGMTQTFFRAIRDSQRNYTISILLKMGASPNLRVNRGETLLMEAILYKQVSVVKTLLAAGADVHLRDSFDNTAIILAANKYSSEILLLLLEAGANINERDKWESTPLIIACCDPIRSVKIVEILLQYPNIDIHAQNIAEFNAYSIAKRVNCPQVIELLEKAGAII